MTDVPDVRLAGVAGSRAVTGGPVDQASREHEEATPVEGAMPSGSGKRPLMRIVRVVFGVVAVLFVSVAVAQRWQEVSATLAEVNIGAMLASAAALLLALAASLLSWRAVLADVGSPLPVRPAARVLLLGQLGKYMPGGSLWAVMAHMELARDLGVPRRRSAAAGLVLNAMSLGTGLLLAVIAVPALLSANQVSGWTTWLVVASPLCLVLLAPPILTRLTNVALRVLRREPLDRPFTWPGVLQAAGWALAMWLLTGVHIWVLGVSLGADPASFALPALGGYAAAWSLGFLFMIAPAGAGVRDVLIVVTLAPALPGGATTALTIALISRLLSVVTDVLAAVIGHGIGRTRAPVAAANR
jgi:hypothetical protein